jgi:hypothetical protein
MREKSLSFSQPTASDIETFSKELESISLQDDQMFSSDDLISPSSSGFQFDLYHYADFIQSMNRYESFESIYRQVRGKFWLSPEQFYSFKITMECLREVISKKYSIHKDEEDFFEALKWVVKTKGLEANEDGLNMKVVKISSVIQDILYLLIHFEKTLPDNQSIGKSPDTPKYVGLIFTNHPCGLNKDESTFQSLLQTIEKLHKVPSSKKDSIKDEIKQNLKTLLEPSIEKLKPKVRDETLTLQDQLIKMSKTLVEQMEDSDNVEVRLDTWTGIEADRNATTPELQMQTVILNKMKGFEVYQHHLAKMKSEIVLMEIPEESDIPKDTFGEDYTRRINKEMQDKKRLKDFENLDLSTESISLLRIFDNSSKNFMKFEKGMKKGLDMSKYLARLIVFRWIRDIINLKHNGIVPERFLTYKMKAFYESDFIDLEDKNSYISDTIQQFFSDLTLQNLFEDIATTFLPKVTLRYFL